MKMVIQGKPKVKILNEEGTLFEFEGSEDFIQFDNPGVYSEDYYKIKEKLEQSPDYIKQTYNDNFAVSAHAIKIPTKSQTTYQEINRLVDIWQKYEDGELIEVVRCADCALGTKSIVNGKIKRHCKVFDEWMPVDGYCHRGYIEDDEEE